MRQPHKNAEVNAILSELAARRLTEGEAYARITALSRASVDSASAEPTYAIRFDFDDPLLRDHQLFGRRVLMGVAHCSLALEAARARSPNSAGWRMEKVTFHDAVQVAPGEAIDIAVGLAAYGEGWEFTSSYQAGASGTNRPAASGRIFAAARGRQEAVELEVLLSAASRVEEGSNFYSEHPAYGPSLRTLRKISYGADALIGEFEIPSDVDPQGRPFSIAPAFFDSAYVASLHAAGKGTLGGDLWVPLFVRETEIDVPAPERWFCRTWLRRQNDEVFVTDHEFYGPGGLRIGFLRGLTVKRVRSPDALGIRGTSGSKSPPIARPSEGFQGTSDLARRTPATGEAAGLQEQVEAYLRERIGAIANHAPEDVSVERPFLDLGADSASLIAIVNKMEKEMGIELYPTLFFEYQTIRELGGYLAAEHREALAMFFGEPAARPSATPVASAPLKDASLGAPVAAAPRRSGAGSGDIAVIGMSGRFARSKNLSEFWNHLRDGTDLVGEIPPDHWDYRPWFDPRPNQEQKTYCRWGSFLDDIDKFDPLFFHMSPREADSTDPQLRLLLEVLFETVEDAGYASKIWGTKTGMYVGVCFKEYWDEIVRQRVPVTAMESFSSAMSFLANRPSYFFDLRGPSVPVDDACSSSLVALHLACKALQRGECDMAFAAGINVLLSPLHYVYFSALGALSPTGRCHSFSNAADGYVPGEGIVSVLLKPLESAIRDNDNIHAVIKGSAINHGGRANNPTSPRTQLQTEVLRSAWSDAQVEPETLGYLEAHGTGTLLGDPIEVDALKRAFKPFTSKTGFCALGSAKANLGHTEGAAGLAGFVKVILSMKHGTIPAMPGFGEPNPYLQLEGSPLYINAERRPWPAPSGHPRRAGVSSFGMGGAYAHVVVEEYADRRPSAPDSGPHLFVLSALNEERLRSGVDRFRHFLEGDGVSCAASDLCYTLQVGRLQMDHRFAVVFNDRAQLRGSLEDFVRARVLRDGGFVGQRKAKGEHPPGSEQKSWWEAQDLLRLAEAWVNGADVPWGELPRRGPVKRVSLPFYVFEQRSHWLPATGREGPEWSSHEGLHALIDRVVPSFRGAEFSKAFRGDESVLLDHRVSGEPLLPGVAHLEMALAAAGALGRGEVASLSDVVWRRPLVVGPAGRDCRLRFVEDSGVSWSLQSSGNTFTEGRVEFAANPKGDAPPRIELQGIRTRCREVIDRTEVYGRFARLGIQYGESLRPIARILAGESEALAVLEEMPNGGAFTSTRMLDGLLQTSIAFYRGVLTQNEVGLPYSVDSVRILGAPSRSCLAYVRALVLPAPGRDAVYNMVLADPEGAMFAEFSGVRIRSARVVPLAETGARSNGVHGADDGGPKIQCFVPHWNAAEPAEARSAAGRTLIFRHARDIGLSERLAGQARGAEVVTVHLGRGYERLGEGRVAIDCRRAEDFARVVEGYPDLDTIYFLGGLPLGTPEETDFARIAEIKTFGVLSLLRLVKALPSHRKIRLLVLTLDHYSLGPADVAPYPFGALVTGAAKVVAKEYPNWRVSCMDFSSRDEPVIDLLSKETCLDIAVRNGRRYERELEPVELPEPTPGRLPLRKSGVYLIIGGAGGLGLAVSRYLGEAFQGRLILVGRREPSPEQKRAISDIESHGGQVLFCRADAADPAAMREVVREARARFGPLNGAIHSALTLRDQSMARMDDEAFHSVLASKLEGSWVLDAVTRDEPLDFLVFFSSANSILANAGQSNYVAGCTFQDAFADRLRRTGRPAQVVNWGLWGEVGIMAGPEHQARLKALGVYPIRVSEGIEQWTRILGGGLGQVVSARMLPAVFESFGVRIGSNRRLLAAESESVADSVERSLEVAGSIERASADSCEAGLRRLEDFCAEALFCVLTRMGALPARAGERVDVRFPSDWSPRYRSLWPTLLDILVRQGFLGASGEGISVRERRSSPQAEIGAPGPDALSALRELAEACLKQFDQVVRGKTLATDVLFPNASMELVEPVYSGNPLSDLYNRLVAEGVLSFIRERCRSGDPHRPLRILEIGSGTGGTSQFILDSISRALAEAAPGSRPVEFLYTDISQVFTDHGFLQFGAAYPFAKFHVLNIEADPARQGFELYSADMVIAANVLHATRSIDSTLTNVKQLMRRNGLLVLNELSQASIFATLTFGLLDGWWLSSDPERRIKGSPILSVAGWREAMHACGFRKVAAFGGATERQSLIVAENDGVVPATEPVVPVKARMDRSAPVAFADPIPQGDSVEDVVRREVAATVRLNPSEVDGDKRFTEFGVDSILAVELVKRLNRVLDTTLKTTVLFDHSSVNEMAAYLRTILKGRNLVADPLPASDETDKPIRGVVLHGPGDVADLKPEPIAVGEPKNGEIQIEIRAFGLNFGDWLCVRGLYPFMPEYPFVPGFEVAGQVRQIGPGATRFRPGDAVIALTGPRFGGQAERINVDERLVTAKPEGVSYEDAASYPVAFLTAYKAIEEARLRPGEKILIQTAAGGTGLMAVQLAQARGAEIFATAGSQEKLDYLNRIGVREAINYRVHDFSAEVRKRTNGYGVDVVLNMLSGDAIQKGLDLLAPGGRYIEIALGGLKSAGAIDLSGFTSGQSIHAINLLQLVRSGLDEMPKHLDTMARHLSEGRIRPAVARAFAFSDIAEAYRYFESRKNIGKIVVSIPSGAPRPPEVPEKPIAKRDVQDIAIIGMSGRFPGSDDLDEFWENLAAGHSSVEEVPSERWPLEGFYDPNPAALDRSISKWGGFLSRIDRFDPLFFNISGREAERMDPQQRLFLEEAWHALEDAGYNGREMSEAKCGLFVGVSAGDYSLRLKAAGVATDGYVFTGNQSSILAARLAYFLNLKGPALAVDTACSSSLVAIHLACQALRQGEIGTALVGGVFINTTSNFHVLCSKAGMLSPSGQCKVFDQSADGFVPGEGVGAILLKPLPQAIADGDRICAVIKGSSVNQDGKTNGITAPSALSQSELERDVYSRFGIDPVSITSVEAHGTGTKLGDPIEVEGLTRAFRAYTSKSGYCALGSVKSNIGHAATAAGIASVLKAILSLRHRKIPPSLHFQTENEDLHLSDSPFFINRTLRDWPAAAEHPRRIAVSSFGFSGTNCHLVLEEAPLDVRRPARSTPLAWLFTLSAKSVRALEQKRRDLLEWLTENPECDLSKVSQTLNAGRDDFEFRLAFVAADRLELAAVLASKPMVDDSKVNIRLTADKAVEEAGRESDPVRHRAALEALARHYENGTDIPWGQFYRGSPRLTISLPGYPFEGERFWAPEAAAVSHTNQTAAVPRSESGVRLKKVFISGSEAFLRDHVINGEPLVPAAVHLEWARSAATNAFSSGGIRLENCVWRAPLRPSASGDEAHVSLTLQAERANIEIRSSGITCFYGQSIQPMVASVPAGLDVDSISERCSSLLDSSALYELFSSRGINYGETFRTVEGIRFNSREVLATLALAKADLSAIEFAWFPGLVDGAFQSMLVLVQRHARSSLNPFVPATLDSLTVHGPLPDRVIAHAVLIEAQSDHLKFDIVVATPEGKPLLEFKGMGVREWGARADRTAVAAGSGASDGHAEAEAVLAGFMAAELKIPVESIRPADPFEKLGIDSMMVDHFNSVLEKQFGPISKTLFFEYQNLRDLAAYFSRKHGPQMRAWANKVGEGNGNSVVGNGEKFGADCLQPALTAGGPVVIPAHGSDAPHETSVDEDIAIVGISGRFPQSRDLASFWDNLKSGKDCITEVPPERWSAADWYDPNPMNEGKIYAKWGGFIENFDHFDPLFFKISPQEAELMDPQERQFLEVAYATLEDAGYTPAGLRELSAGPRRKDVGVFVGVMWGDYQLYGAEAGYAARPLPRSAYWSVANRVSYSFDFQGPSLAVDTACSSSLIAIHLACESIQRGHCRAALAGGVNLSLHPNKYLQLCQMRFGSTDGRCRSFGAGGDGYVPGEGVGAVLLKPLSAAIRDGDSIRAVIKATGCNHGGKTNGYSVPNPNAQTNLIADVLEKSGIAPRSISYVEAHGTGTSLGDPIEITGLSHAFEEFTKDRQFCSLGSAKSNIGHLEAAAGVAAVAKVILQLNHRQIAPSIHSATINPNIDFRTTPFYLQRELADWKTPRIGGVEQPRRAAISSFGAGGSNASIILEEFAGSDHALVRQPTCEVIVLSAPDRGQLRERALQLKGFLEASVNANISDVAHTLQVGREAMRFRLAFLARNQPELIAILAEFIKGGEARVHCGEVEGGASSTGKRQRPSSAGPVKSIDGPEAAAQGWVLGESVDWNSLRAGRAIPRRTSLPTYPFNGSRYWVPATAVAADRIQPRQAIPTADFGQLTENELDERLLLLLAQADAAALDSIRHLLPDVGTDPELAPAASFFEPSNVRFDREKASAIEGGISSGRNDRAAANPVSPLAVRHEGRAKEGLVETIGESIGRLLKLKVNPEDRRKPFTDFGLDSISAVKLASDLQAKLGVPVNPANISDNPSIEALAVKLAADLQKGVAP